MKRLSNTTLLTSAHKTETSALASLSSSASVLAERVSPACPPLAPFPAPEASIPVRPYWDACPSGSLLLLQLHVHIQPLRSTVITRFPATMGCPTPAKKTLRVSQVPRLIFPHAPPPPTPESPMAAFTRCFTIGGRLHPLRQTGHSH